MYRNLILPVLQRFDAEWTHEGTLVTLAWAQSSPLGRAILRLTAGPLPRTPVTLWGVTFPNVLGVAAGFDKEARVAEGLGLLGFGHVEVGTLTPRPQAGNPRPRVFRLPEDEALINRMGFPNAGVTTAVSRLRHLPRTDRNFILGVSLGKQKETPLADAAADYVTVMDAVYPYADYLAVNVSSPNTPGLRNLQGGNYLGNLLGTLVARSEVLAQELGKQKRPLLVKIAPDLTESGLEDILEATTTSGVDGIIATNTSVRRKGLASTQRHQKGGLSGRPLRQRSTAVIRTIARKSNLPIIGVGGVQTADDVRQKLDAGASLVQMYTGLIYAGPGVAGRILRQLAADL